MTVTYSFIVMQLCDVMLGLQLSTFGINGEVNVPCLFDFGAHVIFFSGAAMFTYHVKEQNQNNDVFLLHEVRSTKNTLIRKMEFFCKMKMLGFYLGSYTFFPIICYYFAHCTYLHKIRIKEIKIHRNFLKLTAKLE